MRRTPDTAPALPSRLPSSWTWFMDDALPGWVKNHYSPKESWKDKPFTETDARFFIKGIRELSDLFTEDRIRKLPTYLNNPKYRSSYLLYWLPLQSAKFCTLFHDNREALQAALAHGRKTGTMRILDLGAGPATASLALLLTLLDPLVKKDEVPEKIEIDLVDQAREIVLDGKSLLEHVASHFPKLKGRVTVNVHAREWTDWVSREWRGESSLILFGHVLNEALFVTRPGERSELVELKKFDRLFAGMNGGGMLFVEPAAKNSSQLLSRLRDAWIEEGQLAEESTAIWGPCLHAGRCPLASGKDWCHFSIPTKLPSKWLTYLSKGLSTEREWLKFAYLWIAAKDFPSPKRPANLRRVVSDPMKAKTVRLSDLVLLCEPEVTHRYALPKGKRLWRGDLIELKK